MTKRADAGRRPLEFGVRPVVTGARRTMKVKITFKDPDGVYECVRAAVIESLPDGLSDDEQEGVLESRTEATFEKMKKWLRFKEYVTVEFDTYSCTATVLPA